MLGDWQNWCRLCAKTDSTEEDSWYKAESIKEQLAIVSEHFKISIEPYETDQQCVQPLICAECYDLLTKFDKFKRRCFKTDEMFKQLTWVKYISDPELQALRAEYAVDTDEEKSITQLEAPQSTSRTQRKRSKSKESKKRLFVVSHNKVKAYIVVPYEGDELEYDDFIRKACSYLKVREISTIYDQKEIKIDAESFKYVMEKNPPEYLIVDSSHPSATSLTDSIKIGEDSVQCLSVSDQSSDTGEMDLGDSLVMKQEAPEVMSEPAIKVRKLRLLQGNESRPNDLLFALEPDPQTISVPSMQNDDWPAGLNLFSTDEPSNATSLPPANFNMSLFSIHLKDILNCPDGHRIISFYRARGELDRTRRDRLITLILDYSDQQGLHLSCKILEALSEEIQLMFPSEPKEYYYTPKNAFQKSYSGILYARYHNRRRSVKKKQEVDNNHTFVQKSDTPEYTACPMEKLKQLKTILSSKESEDITPEIIEMWNKCFFLRRGDFMKKDNAILEWPLLSQVNGHVLIDEDFAKCFAKAQALDRKWKEFHNNIIPVLKMYIKDRQSKETLDNLIDYTTNEEMQHSTIFLLLHSVLKPRGFLRQPDPNDPTKIKYIRPTIIDAQDSMLITIDSEQQLETRVQTFESHLQETGRKFHPIIFRILSGGYHVYCYKGLKYQIQTLKEAIDICFKAFHVIYRGDYPLESEVVWYFIQTYFYEVKTSSDARFVGSCVDIINQLNRAANSKIM